VVAAVLLAMFMAAMEATVIGTAMPTVVGDLGGLELYGWVGAVYMLATTVTIPIYGKLADVLGRKPIMLVGIAIFLAGSIGSGLAHSMTALIVMRAIQGVGAGGIQPVAITIVGDIYTPRERARIQGIFGAVWGLAGISGPLLGGLIVHALSWRWVFYVNVPFGLVSAALLVIGLREKSRAGAKRPPLDFVGVVVLTLAVLALLGGAHAFWLLPVGFALVGLFVFVERRHPAPVLPIELLSRRLMAVSSVNGAIVGAVMTATVVYVPLYVQAVLLGTPTEAGTAVAPMLVGWPLASAFSGRLLLRLGPRPLVRMGFICVALASVAVDYLVNTRSGLHALQITMFAFGVGMGLANTALLIAVQDSVGFAERGVATASTMFFRTIGGALAVGLLGGLMASALAGKVPPEILDDLLGPTHGKNLAPSVVSSLADSLHLAMSRLFHVILALGLLGAASGLFFPPVTLKNEPRG
jgi:EmrB/QacA subfamily drug resistance transporter